MHEAIEAYNTSFPKASQENVCLQHNITMLEEHTIREHSTPMRWRQIQYTTWCSIQDMWPIRIISYLTYVNGKIFLLYKKSNHNFFLLNIEFKYEMTIQ